MPPSFPEPLDHRSQRAGLRLVVLLVTASFAWPATADPPAPVLVRDWARAEIPALVEIYREFHAHPELSLQERDTAARLASLLEAAGCEVTTGVGGHGIVAVLRNGDRPVVMLRTELDALPVTEQTGLPFASQVKASDAGGTETGVMHACGHDIHMTTLVGAARFLAAHRDAWQGCVVFVGQPAEEKVLGAKAMLEDGLFTRFPRPEHALALHCDAGLAAGRVGISPGFVLANTDSVEIVVRGRGGHGAYPDKTVDPIVQAAELVLSLQALVSREVLPTEPAVVTVGAIHGGTRPNIIGDECRLQVTVRCYSDAVRSLLLEGIERKALAIATAYRAPAPTVTVIPGVPAVENDPQLTERIEEVFVRVLGAGQVEPAEKSLGGEDFALFGRAGVPSLMFRLGTIAPARLARYREAGDGPPALHSALFYPDPEPTLLTGVVALTEAALALLR
jgi:amidohydrolase